MERFFPLKHLTVDQLQDLYRDARKVGKLLVEYDKPGTEGHYELTLSDEEILKNISAECNNYFVFHENFEDDPDMITIGFPLSKQVFMTAYIDVENLWLDWFVKKYNLAEWWQMEWKEKKHYPFSKFYELESVKRHDPN